MAVDSDAYEEFQEINMVLSVSEERCEEFQKKTKEDSELQAVLTMVRNGWKDTKQQLFAARQYWTFRDEVATADGLLFKGTRFCWDAMDSKLPLQLFYYSTASQILHFGNCWELAAMTHGE